MTSSLPPVRPWLLEPCDRTLTELLATRALLRAETWTRHPERLWWLR